MKVIRRFFEDDRNYFKNCQHTITEQNSNLIFGGCIVYAIVLALFSMITITGSTSLFSLKLFYLFDTIHVFLCVYILSNWKRIRKNFYYVQTLCIIFEFTYLVFFIIDGVFGNTTQHSLYIPIAIIMVQVLFIHKAAYAFTIISLYNGLFYLGSYLYKTPEAFTNDSYIALASFISAIFGYVLSANMRHREGKALRKFEILSKKDMLTNLYNRGTLEEECNNYLSYSNRRCAFLIFDIDDFKGINDKHGHKVGDEAIRLIGNTLSRCFRINDIVGRYGGDEFIVLMDSCDDKKIVIDRINQFDDTLSDVTNTKHYSEISCSIGISFKRADDDFLTIFERADNALYKAKRNKELSYCFAD